MFVKNVLLLIFQDDVCVSWMAFSECSIWILKNFTKCAWRHGGRYQVFRTIKPALNVLPDCSKSLALLVYDLFICDLSIDGKLHLSELGQECHVHWWIIVCDLVNVKQQMICLGNQTSRGRALCFLWYFKCRCNRIRNACIILNDVIFWVRVRCNVLHDLLSF